jgi:hypothetical protein
MLRACGYPVSAEASDLASWLAVVRGRPERIRDVLLAR